jgi:hypothetical protein
VSELRTATKRRTDVLAHLLTELLAPVVLAYVTCLAVAVGTTPSASRGVLIGLVVATSCAGLPYAVIALASRRRLLSGRHVPELRERPGILVLCAVAAAAGLALAVVLRASPAVFALVAATVVGLGVAAAISTRWKLSIHLAAGCGALCATTVTLTPWLLVASPAVVALGWARVHLGDHDAAQVLGGAVVGAGVTSLVMLTLL